MKFNQLSLFDQDLSKIWKKQGVSYITTVNAHAFVVAQRDSAFKQSLLLSEVVLADGISISWANLFLKQRWVKKISGYDAMLNSLNYANEKGLTVSFYGSNETTLKAIKSRINLEFPNVSVHVHDPGIRKHPEDFLDDDLKSLVKKSDILFIGLTAPKQEKLSKIIFDLDIKKKYLKILPVGAAFDFYAKTVKRSGVFWRRIGLEFFPRLLREPRRLWKRTFVSAPKFIMLILIEIWRKR